MRMSSKRPRVPQRHEVAVQGFFVVLIALLGDDQRAQSILRNAPRAAELDGFDDILGRLSRSEWRAGLPA